MSEAGPRAESGGRLFVHLGCGRRHIPGFVHVDLGDYPHVDFRHPIETLPMFADESVDLIYCCHAFEYLDRQQAAGALLEWRRVLKSGALLRLAVPDFSALVEVYRETGNLDRIIGPLYGRIEIPTSEAPRVMYHRTTYDYESLERLLLDAGFTAVRRYDWRETPHRDVDDFSQAYVPHMQQETGRLISLNVEAVR